MSSLPSARRDLHAIAALVRDDPHGARRKAELFARTHRDLPAAHRVLAMASRAAGQDADRHDLAAIAAALRTPALAAAQADLAAGHHEAAERRVRSWLRETDPECPAAALMLGRIAAHHGAIREAINLCRRALLIAPAYVEAAMAIAQIQFGALDLEPALVTLDALLARAPGHAEALALKAGTLVQLRRLDAADATFVILRALVPDDARALMNHAFLLKTMGRQAEAISAYRASVAIDPGNGQAWWGLANLKTVRLGAADLATMQAAAARPNLAEEERLHLDFAIGRALEDAGRFGEAFAAFSAGSRRRLAAHPHDPGQVHATVQRAAALFTPDFYAARVGWGCLADDPIFIVSLPRSGSTLVEQILASHPDVEGTEELFDIERIAAGLAGDAPPAACLNRIAGLTAAEVRALGEDYIAGTRRFRTSDRPRFTDKMPGNWVYAGLIRLILPRARIVDIRRHPLANGVANFTQHFNWGINFSYDLAHIGAFYADYVRMMAHLDRAVPGHIHHLTYEALIDDLPGEVTRMLDALGLPFAPACLRFHETERPIHTPSSGQVRQPIFRDALARWRGYEPWLEPLERALGPVLDHYPDVPPDFG